MNIIGVRHILQDKIVFIVIYVAFAAISLNYAKAFRIKNKVISYIEENEYCYEPGIKIKQIKRPLDANKLGVYYKVSAYFGYDIGFLKLLRAGNGSVDTSGGLGFWEVSGETRPIVKD